MSFKVAYDKWLQEETDRVEAFILMPKWWRRRWRLPALRRALADIGLDYSMPEVTQINEELHRRGVVEDVGE